MSDDDYESMIVWAVKRLYIDTGRALAFKGIIDDTSSVLNVDLDIDEQEYVMILAQINFYKRVQTDVNNIVGYTTNALTVTGADKPYAHLQDTIANLENERRIVYYKMHRYTFDE